MATAGPAAAGECPDLLRHAGVVVCPIDSRRSGGSGRGGGAGGRGATRLTRGVACHRRVTLRGARGHRWRRRSAPGVVLVTGDEASSLRGVTRGRDRRNTSLVPASPKSTKRSSAPTVAFRHARSARGWGSGSRGARLTDRPGARGRAGRPAARRGSSSTSATCSLVDGDGPRAGRARPAPSFAGCRRPARPARPAPASPRAQCLGRQLDSTASLSRAAVGGGPRRGDRGPRPVGRRCWRTGCPRWLPADRPPLREASQRSRGGSRPWSLRGPGPGTANDGLLGRLAAAARTSFEGRCRRARARRAALVWQSPRLGWPRCSMAPGGGCCWRRTTRRCRTARGCSCGTR